MRPLPRQMSVVWTNEPTSARDRIWQLSLARETNPSEVGNNAPSRWPVKCECVNHGNHTYDRSLPPA
jgi:hypothetical protein